MKSIIQIPICNKLKVKNPTTEMFGNEIVISWDYQLLSFACQGNWANQTWRYEKNEFNFNSMIFEVESFINDFFKIHGALSHLEGQTKQQ